jgi:hypothetical protein
MPLSNGGRTVDSEQFETFMAVLKGMVEEWETTNHWLREMIGLLEPMKIYLEFIDNKLERIASQG